MTKEYRFNEGRVPARPRSKRRREAGIGGGTVIVGSSSNGLNGGDESNVEGHTHANKGTLDKLGIDGSGYVTVTSLQESSDGSATEREDRAKVGYADGAGYALESGEADHLAEDSDDWQTIDETIDEKINAQKSIDEQKYLRKDQDDETDHSLGVGGDLNVGGDSNVEGDLNVEGDAEVGGTLAVEELIVKLLHTPGFVDGLISGGIIGKGFGVKIDANGKATLQTNDLIVLGRMIVNSLNVREVTYIGGTYLLTPAGSTVENVVPLYSSATGDGIQDTRTWTTEGSGAVVGYRLMWKADDGTTGTMNYWHKGDQAFCQTFNITSAGDYTQAQNHRWWRLVVNTGSSEHYHYADVANMAYVKLYDGNNQLSNEAGSMLFAGIENGNGTAPAAGDKAMCLGSQLDTARQGAVQITAEGTASIGIYDGINNYAALSTHEIHLFSKERVRLNATRFEWTTENNVSLPPTIYCGDWSSGKKSSKGYEWTYNGTRWLYLGENITTEAPGTTSANWQEVKGAKGDKGDTGPRGEQGIQGPKGDDGERGATGAQGDPGVNGLDGWTLTAFPSALNLMQAVEPSTNSSYQLTSDFDLPQYITFTGKCGNDNATVNSISVTDYEGVVASVPTGANYDYVAASVPNGTPYIKVNSVTRGANNGYIDATVGLSSGGRNINISVRIPIAISWQGTINTTIKGSVEQTVAQKVQTEIQNGNFVRMSTLGDYVRSDSEDYVGLKSTVSTDHSTLENHGQRLLSAEQSVQGFETSINGAVVAASEAKQTAEGFSLSVYGTDDAKYPQMFDDPEFMEIAGGSWTRANDENATTVSQTAGGKSKPLKTLQVTSTSTTTHQSRIYQALISKLTAGGWYSISFYAKVYGNGPLASEKNVTNTSWTSGGVISRFYVLKGRKYRITVTGRATSGGTLYVRLATSYSTSSSIAEKSTSATEDTNLVLEYEATADTSIVIQARTSSSSYAGKISKYNTDGAGCGIFIGSSNMDTTNVYADGKRITPFTSSFVQVDLGIPDAAQSSATWRKHVVTFKLKDTLGSSCNIGFSVFAGHPQVEIYHPCLCEGCMDISAGLRRTGIDVLDGTVDVQADDFTVHNSDGEQILGLNSDGDFEVGGTVKAKDFYHRCVTFWPSNNYIPMQRQYIGPTTTFFKKGNIYDQEYLDDLETSNPSAWNYYDSNASTYFIECTGSADIINFTTRTSNNNDITGPTLPDPNTCPGKTIQMFTYDYSDRNNDILVNCAAESNGNSLRVLTFSVYPDGNNHLVADTVQTEVVIGLGGHYQFHSVAASGGDTEYVWWCIRTK